MSRIELAEQLGGMAVPAEKQRPGRHFADPARSKQDRPWPCRRYVVNALRR